MEFRTMSIYRYPLYILLHPIDGFQELKYNKKGSLKLANLILALWYVATALNRQCEGFIFNMNNPEKLNLAAIFVGTIIVFAVAVISNWSFSTLMEGEGSFKAIWISGSYALLPYIVSLIITTILSRFFTIEEGTFLNYISIIGGLWTGILIFYAVMVTHDFTMGKTVALLFLTIFGIAAILFLVVLLYGLFNQLVMFVVNLYSELLVRLTMNWGN